MVFTGDWNGGGPGLPRGDGPGDRAARDDADRSRDRREPADARGQPATTSTTTAGSRPPTCAGAAARPRRSRVRSHGDHLRPRLLRSTACWFARGTTTPWRTTSLSRRTTERDRGALGHPAHRSRLARRRPAGADDPHGAPALRAGATSSGCGSTTRERGGGSQSWPASRRGKKACCSRALGAVPFAARAAVSSRPNGSAGASRRSRRGRPGRPGLAGGGTSCAIRRRSVGAVWDRGVGPDEVAAVGRAAGLREQARDPRGRRGPSPHDAQDGPRDPGRLRARAGGRLLLRRPRARRAPPTSATTTNARPASNPRLEDPPRARGARGRARRPLRAPALATVVAADAARILRGACTSSKWRAPGDGRRPDPSHPGGGRAPAARGGGGASAPGRRRAGGAGSTAGPGGHARVLDPRRAEIRGGRRSLSSTASGACPGWPSCSR